MRVVSQKEGQGWGGVGWEEGRGKSRTSACERPGVLCLLQGSSSQLLFIFFSFPKHGFRLHQKLGGKHTHIHSHIHTQTKKIITNSAKMCQRCGGDVSSATCSPEADVVERRSSVTALTAGVDTVF